MKQVQGQHFWPFEKKSEFLCAPVVKEENVRSHSARHRRDSNKDSKPVASDQWALRASVKQIPFSGRACSVNSKSIVVEERARLQMRASFVHPQKMPHYSAIAAVVNYIYIYVRYVINQMHMIILTPPSTLSNSNATFKKPPPFHMACSAHLIAYRNLNTRLCGIFGGVKGGWSTVRAQRASRWRTPRLSSAATHLKPMEIYTLYSASQVLWSEKLCNFPLVTVCIWNRRSPSTSLRSIFDLTTFHPPMYTGEIYI